MLESRQEPILNTWPPWPRAYASSFLLFPLLRPFLAAAVSQSVRQSTISGRHRRRHFFHESWLQH